jgi:hypothetical protein
MRTPSYSEANGGDVRTTVKYLQPDSENVRYFSKGIEVNTGKYDDVSVVVHDARPNKEEYTLANGGFALIQHSSKVCYDICSLEHALISRTYSSRIFTLASNWTRSILQKLLL